ncbi:MAG: hypothetical protein JWR19_1823 [Pedosphaera sp.]|nr:hypothetical protein [Pedosphaera sp.]
MKWLLKAVLLCSLAVNLCLGLVLYSHAPRQSERSADAMKQFAITNLDGSVSGDGYVVVFQNGKYWWTIDGNILSMNAGVNQEMTLRLDETSGRVKSTTIELTDAKGQHCYFTDMNADGIPDKKRIGGEENWLVFLGGDFVPSFAKGESRYVMRTGTNLLVTFDGTQWKAAE